MIIILFLKDVFKIYYCHTIESFDMIKLDDTIYSKDFNSNQNNGFIGFFDWLRTDKFTIVGIRICYFEHHNYNDVLGKYSYTKLTNEGKWIEILFKNIQYDHDISGDQDFTNNYVYKSEEGVIYLRLVWIT
jgi:hypothetical protein